MAFTVAQRTVIERDGVLWVPSIDEVAGKEFCKLSKRDRSLASIMGVGKSSNPFNVCGWFEDVIAMRTRARDALLAQNDTEECGLFAGEGKRTIKPHEREQVHVLALDMPELVDGDNKVGPLQMNVLSTRSQNMCVSIECTAANLAYVHKAVNIWAPPQAPSDDPDEPEPPVKYRRRCADARVRSGVSRVLWNYDRSCWYVVYTESNKRRTKSFTPKWDEDANVYASNCEHKRCAAADWLEQRLEQMAAAVAHAGA